MSARCPDGHTSESEDYCDTCGLPIAASSSSVPASSPPPLPSSPLPPPLPTVPVPVNGFDVVAGAALGSAPGGSAADKPCPNCDTVVPVGDLFCENCGYDFTTGALPEPLPDPAAAPESPAPGDQAVVVPGPGGPAAGPTSGASSGASSGVGAVPGAGASAWVAEIWVDPDWFATQESDDPCPSPGTPIEVTLHETSVLVGRRSTSRNIHPQIDCGTDHGVSRRHAQLTTDGRRWWVEDLQSSNGTFVGPAGAPLPDAPVTPGQRVEFSPGDRIYVGAWTRIVIRPS